MLKIIKKAAGAMLEVAGLRVPGATAGQTLVANADGVFTPGAGGGGGSLPAGTNGGVMTYAGGAWGSTGAGAAGQVLLSNGALAPSWGQTVLPLTQRAVDSASAGVTVCGRLTHELAADLGAPGIGVRFEMRVSNGSGDVAPIAAIDAVATAVAGDAEVGVLDVVLANAGGAVDTRSARFWASGVALGGVSAAPASDTGVALAWASRAIVVRGSGNAAWMDVWRVNGSSEWQFGTDDATDCTGAVLQAPSSGAGLYLRRGSTNHVAVNSAGAIVVGTTAHTTALQGTNVTLAGTTGLQIGSAGVVTVYVGGARVPERTLSASTTLDAQDEVVFVDTTAGAVTLTLPAGASGRILSIQRISGSNNVIVQRSDTDTIRAAGSSGLASWTISDGARHGLIYRSGGTEWVAEA